MAEQMACCGCKNKPQKKGFSLRGVDWILWGSLAVIAFCYVSQLIFGHQHTTRLGLFRMTAYEMANSMFGGVLFGIVAIGLMSRIPRSFVMGLLGSSKGAQGVVRAAFAGVLFDLCSHGILMVAIKLYERGATLGQVMAFLISSPWNSFSLTVILASLIGLKWTVLFILLSMVMGVVSGLIFDALVTKGILPANHHQVEEQAPVRFWSEAKRGVASVRWTPAFIFETVKLGLRDSRMVLRWIFFGVLIAASVRAIFPPDMFNDYFGPSVIGLFVTLFGATVIEVCSQGTAPLAADIITRAGAVGNGFVFLMAGVSTNYTQMLALKEATKSWKIPLFLPLITIPQILVVAYILNQFPVK